MAKRKVIVLGVNAPDRQAVIETLLAGHRVEFVGSAEEASLHCHGADIIALGTDHEKHVPVFYKSGFKGIIVPLLVSKVQGMMVKDKFVPAVSVSELPDCVVDIFKQIEPIAA